MKRLIWVIFIIVPLIQYFKYHVSVKGFDYLTEEQIEDIQCSNQ